VRQRLALANLTPEVKSRYRNGDIPEEALALLTLGSREKQRAYVKLLDDPDAAPPQVWQLKAFMLGGPAIEARHALFPLADFTGAVTSDLFSDATYLEPDAFWSAQRAAAATQAAEARARGWSFAQVLGPDEPYYPMQWEDATKAEGGGVLIRLHADGHAETIKGVIERDARKARARIAAEASGLDGDTTSGEVVAMPEERRAPERTQALANMTALIRHSTVAAAVLAKPRIALRLMVAQLLAGSDHIHAAREPRTPASGDIATTVAAMPSEAAQERARHAALQLLGLDGDDTLFHRHGTAAHKTQLLEKLLALSDREVMAVLAVIAAETLDLTSPLIDTLAAATGADCAATWTCAETTDAEGVLLGMVRSRAVIASIAADVLDAEDAAIAANATIAEARGRILARLATLKEKGRAAAAPWTPRWLAFPEGNYQTTEQSDEAAAA